MLLTYFKMILKTGVTIISCSQLLCGSLNGLSICHPRDQNIIISTCRKLLVLKTDCLYWKRLRSAAEQSTGGINLLDTLSFSITWQDFFIFLITILNDKTYTSFIKKKYFKQFYFWKEMTKWDYISTEPQRGWEKNVWMEEIFFPVILNKLPGLLCQFCYL